MYHADNEERVNGTDQRFLDLLESRADVPVEDVTISPHMRLRGENDEVSAIH